VTDVTVFDYGAGNLHSLVKALEAGGARVRVERDAALLGDAPAIVLPGVGAFAPAAAELARGLAVVRAAAARGTPVLGICLGLQLLAESSEEGAGAGLGIMRGGVGRLTSARVPQIGWNALDEAHDPLLTASRLSVAYYANSYVVRPTHASQVVAWSTHEGDRFPAVMRAGRTVGVQFHPEKSSRAGLAFVRAWVEEAAA
jgi:glutamine amidotransferase